jgi:hypothetical protein
LPVLFLIYANAALERTNRAGGFTDTSYVDDVSIVASRTRPDDLIRDLQERTNKQIARAQHLRLSLAPSKSELILGLPATSKYRNNPQKIPHNLRVTADLTVAGRPVVSSPTVKYLGVTIDDGLAFRTHAARDASKGLQALGSRKQIERPRLYCASPRLRGSVPTDAVGVADMVERQKQRP